MSVSSFHNLNLQTLPSLYEHLWNLQTAIMLSSSDTVEIIPTGDNMYGSTQVQQFETISGTSLCLLAACKPTVAPHCQLLISTFVSPINIFHPTTFKMNKIWTGIISLGRKVVKNMKKKKEIILTTYNGVKGLSCIKWNLKKTSDPCLYSSYWLSQLSNSF